MLDTQEVFGEFQAAFQQLIQMAQQRNQSQQQLPPDAQVVKDTSMAETQRKTQKDQSDAQLAQAKLKQALVEHQMDNQTKIEIKNAELTHETITNIAQAQQPPAMQAPTNPPQQGV
jgi:hypothetical protein